MTEQPRIYADDPDAHVTYPITDGAGNDLDFSPVVLVSGQEVTAAWQGDVAPVRDLRIPLSGLAGGRRYTLRLMVPGDNDLDLGRIFLT